MLKAWSFRRRLVATIALLFITGATVLLAVQYFIVREIVRSEVTISAQGLISSSCPDDADCDAFVASRLLDKPRAIVAETSCSPSSPGEVEATLKSGVSPSGVSSSGDSSSGVSSSGVSSSGDSSSGLPESISTTTTLSTLVEANESIGQRLLFWSAVVLALFALLSIGAANWLAKRSLARVTSISQTARQINASDRSARLELDGPADEIKELADTFDEMLGRLDEALTRQEAFVAAASHELRTPLATVHTSLEVPAIQGRFPADTLPSIERALTANQKSLKLLEALTTLSKMQLTSTTSYPGSLERPLATALGQIAESASASSIRVHAPELAAGGGLGLGGEVDGGLDGGELDGGGLDDGELNGRGSDGGELDCGELNGDPAGELGNELGSDESLLAIAIENLLRNAVSHNIAEGQVWVTLDQRKVVVTNTGPDLSAEQVSEFSQAFNRGEQTRISGGGLGLGLTVATAIAAHFSGSLTLTPREGGGLVATLAL